MTDKIIVYTDGACSKNGKEGAKAGYGIYFGRDDSRNVSKRIKGKQTNNRAELTAIIQTYYILQGEIQYGEKVDIYTDSVYSMRCCTTYGEKQEKIGWSKTIPNKALVKKAYNLYKDKENVKFYYIKAHTKNNDIHSIGNKEADRLATSSLL